MVKRLGFVLLLFGLAGSAIAAPSRVWFEPMHLLPFEGDPENLPVNCRVTPEDLVAHARAMAAVQTAMAEFTARGYLAIAGADTAVILCSEGKSAVALVYSKPGAFIDSFHVVVPTIVVTTQLADVGDPVTSVTAGILVGDGQTGRFFNGDSLDVFHDTDHSFDVRREGGIVLEHSPLDPQSRFGRWARCTGWNTIGCVGGMLRFGGAGFHAIKLATLAAQPEIGLAILEGCALASGLLCLGGY
jgi:hypothetical protein